METCTWSLVDKIHPRHIRRANVETAAVEPEREMGPKSSHHFFLGIGFPLLLGFLKIRWLKKNDLFFNNNPKSWAHQFGTPIKRKSMFVLIDPINMTYNLNNMDPGGCYSQTCMHACFTSGLIEIDQVTMVSIWTQLPDVMISQIQLDIKYRLKTSLILFPTKFPSSFSAVNCSSAGGRKL